MRSTSLRQPAPAGLMSLLAVPRGAEMRCPAFASLIMNARVPENEAERLQALRRYSILDAPPDGSFDHITALAAELFRVPIALISLVDHDRIWVKSRHGLDAQQIARDPGLCASAIFS